MSKQITFFPAPGEYSGTICTEVYAGKTARSCRWLLEDIADAFGCDDDELHSEDFAWADGERFAEFIVLRGRIIGSLDDQLTAEEWRAVLAVYSCNHLREALEGSLAVEAS